MTSVRGTAQAYDAVATDYDERFRNELRESTCGSSQRTWLSMMSPPRCWPQGSTPA